MPTELPGMGRIRGADGSLTGEDWAFIEDVLRYRDDGVRGRYQRLGLSAEKGQRIKDRLIDAGLLEAVRARSNRTYKLMLQPTRRAERDLGLTPETAQRGSLVHEYYKRLWAEHFRGKGYRVQIEAPRPAGGHVDVLARKRAETVAIEIETGKSDAVGNVKKCLRSRFDRIIVAATDGQAIAKVEKQLAQAGLLIRRRVSVVLCLLSSSYIK